ncbi:hypothetical protein SAMN04488021_1803 [Paracoccus aminovorans]|uniref:Uncharacterized protein n=1 Tax=Paracoccus aminovorans TaxID=34004 RepID=A0A1I3FK09_9RHOB|nr:hypothetical protein [Paracoccus aminovorans]CQR85891.1 hypothetical protein JCM7685_1317 [Paracoccus aminovorans]SFI11549.1 hypothetical protein SAMN04488021_1803 [Paracoccus aminovorans]
MRLGSISAIAVISLCASNAGAEDIKLNIVIANNVHRTTHHYKTAVAEANRILQQCTGVSVKLNNLVKMGKTIGNVALIEEKTRQEVMNIAIAGYGANVLVVNDLRVCGPLKEEAGKNVLGCAGHKSAMTIETLRDPHVEGRAIAHELGHTVNLMWSISNGSAHSPDGNYLMYNSLNPSLATPMVSDAECAKFANIADRYKSPSSVAHPEAVYLTNDSHLPEASGAAFAEEVSDKMQVVTLTLDSILQQTWQGAFPQAELDELMKDETSLPMVRAKVIAGENLTIRQNSADILGAYGQPVDIDILQSSLKISKADDDPAELQRFSAAVITAITNLGITHNEKRAATIIQTLLTQMVAGNSSGLPVEGLDDSQQIDVMSSAATAALEATPALTQAGLIDGPAALIEDSGGDLISDEALRKVIEDSPLLIDRNFMNRIINF